MTAQRAEDPGPDAIDALAVTGVVVAGVLFATLVTRARGSETLLPAFIAVGVGAAPFAVAYAFGPHCSWRPGKIAYMAVRTCGALFGALSALGFAFALHRTSAAAIGLVEASLAYAAVRGTRPFAWFAGIATLGAFGWETATALFHPAMSDWLLDGVPSTGLASVAFVAALVFVTMLAAGSFVGHGRVLRPRAAVAALLTGVSGIYCWLASRTDGVLADWIPYHRSYYVGPAKLMREGHWLLWDIPSQYGFLSIATIALAPGPTTWDALGVVLGGALVVSAVAALGMSRNAPLTAPGSWTIGVVIAAATFGSMGWRWPFGARLYPQIGLRYFFVAVLLALVVAAANRPAWRRRVRLAGHVTTTLAVAWSFEVGASAAFAWLSYLTVEAVVDVVSTGWSARRAVGMLAMRWLALASVLFTAWAIVEGFYRVRLHHGPDWLGYFEFSAIYASDPSLHLPYQPWGVPWVMVTVCSGLIVALIVALRQRRWGTLPALAMMFAMTWLSCSYYVVEAFPNHVNALTMLFTYVAVALWTLTTGWGGGAVLAARLAFVPMAVIVTAVALGETGHLTTIRAPGVPGYVVPQSAAYPKIDGELAALLDRAAPGDVRVLLPTTNAWGKLSEGTFLPFRRTSAGVLELWSWLPTSPVGLNNTYYSVPLSRRQTEIDRFVALEGAAGWYVAYRKPARCEGYSRHLVTLRTISSANFTASLCGYVPALVPGRAPTRGGAPVQ